jgi:hypothetical protein
LSYFIYVFFLISLLCLTLVFVKVSLSSFSCALVFSSFLCLVSWVHLVLSG